MSDRRRRGLPLVALCALLNTAQVAAEPVCRPKLAVKEVSFSETVNARRTWTAAINIDASRCATTSGGFSIRIIRLAENAPDLTFTEPFIWHLGQESVSIEFWANEAVHRYWIEDIVACLCRSD
jgi:hypothetical protein